MRFGEEYEKYYELDRFEVKAEVVHPEIKKNSATSKDQVVIRGKFKRFYEEKNLGFWPEVLTLPDATILSGVFPCEKYFLDIESQIREDFSFSKLDISDETANLIRELEDSESVAVHVRRGDFVGKSVFDICGPKYFHRAIEHVRSRLEAPRFFFFSDDIAWCQENFVAKDFIHTAVPQSRIEPLNDMRLMSLCKHNVTSNSSFSWWSAWLNDNPEKIVVTPSVWFREQADPIFDVACDGWAVISPD